MLQLLNAITKSGNVPLKFSCWLHVSSLIPTSVAHRSSSSSSTHLYYSLRHYSTKQNLKKRITRWCDSSAKVKYLQLLGSFLPQDLNELQFLLLSLWRFVVTFIALRLKTGPCPCPGPGPGPGPGLLRDSSVVG